jgi:hypothetical protein
MRSSIFGLLWSFTAFAAGYDAYFAWQHQAGFQTWELNPFICWLAALGGLHAVIGFKVVTTAFALALACLCRWRQHWLERPLTLTVASIFLGLSVYCVINFDGFNYDPDRERNPVVRVVNREAPNTPHIYRPRMGRHAAKAQSGWL